MFVYSGLKNVYVRVNNGNWQKRMYTRDIFDSDNCMVDNEECFTGREGCLFANEEFIFDG